MNKYRILEKKGETRVGNLINFSHHKSSGVDSDHVHSGSCGDYAGCVCDELKNSAQTHYKVYVPRYIVQGETIVPGNGDLLDCFDCVDKMIFADLKEFNNLEEAKKYKRDLELEDGIVIE